MSIVYTVSPADPCGHWFAVTLAFDATPGDTVSLPAWLRGSYRIRDFAKHVSDVSFVDAQGAPVPWRRVSKSQLAVEAGGRVQMRCRVYAFDPSVRKAFLGTDRGFFNPSSLCWRVDAQADAPVEMVLEVPTDPRCVDWQVATSLHAVEVDARGFGRYRADDYEDLIDQPVELGVFERVDFAVNGMPHALVLAGHAPVDTARVVHDLTRICAVEHALFDNAVTLDRYLFLTQVTSGGYGGLEHRFSTALVCARDDLPRPGEQGTRDSYRNFLGLCAHEYFHLWNVKRLVPQAFAESDLAAEAYTRDLWHYEGVTSYYDDLTLLRAGLVPAADYLDLIARQATRIQRTPGRHVHSLADASFEAWSKFYQPDESTPNLTVSYYGKGALLALGVDLKLRMLGRSLDEALRGLWQVFGAHDTPVPEGALEALVIEMAREVSPEAEADLRAYMTRGVRGTDDLPLAEQLAAFGVTATLRVAHGGTADRGGRATGQPDRNHLGLRFKPADAGIEVTGVVAGGPAERADLAVGDRLVAVDGWQLSASSAATQLAALRPDRPVTVHRFRDRKLIESTLTPAPPAADTWTFVLADDPPADVAARRLAWLGV
jgi:predicted metalloprotease with PDZ domain